MRRAERHGPERMTLISADTLRALIAQRGISYARLARTVGVSRAFISALTLGKRESCKPETAQRIAHSLGAPTNLLFEPTERHAP